MTHALDAVEAAAIALQERSWIPTAEEIALGRDFFARREAVEPRLLPGMPACRNPQGWATQHVLWLEDVGRLAEHVAEAWRGYLPHSHMLALLDAYAAQARPALPLAARLAREWETERPEPCSQQEAVWWEDWHLPADQRQQLDALTERLIIIGSVLVTAVNAGGAG
ncbi:hypothetical protein AB0K09_02855 [Streptomyces sp. NPDC049577]|uniref:hypothetical protein n=1 Tax=Streptomyces sp. NPDC049577 TaxID=3155153 RepID=UPI0034391798